ncbi:uncharacterized protein TRIREDRAFT_109489 [Trichoderma reesei QM6a]|uniref:Predicted protein n=1 Tax=Hypocrea jecorina (strain QM6a) TaxID=431241 RepID=G0RQ06_HYPJQ|nr:uncharacterized protein TRIREDRAFT_109489 [Trichoderma reesei QM6a]EGR46839.1 predicted protein [Trichoderma reesei QM6a]
MIKYLVYIATYYRLDGRDDKDQMADPWFAAYAPPCARAETDKRWSVKTKPSSIPRNTSDGSPLSPNRDNSLFPTVRRLFRIRQIQRGGEI